MTDILNETITDAPPTSTAATRQSEPEVVAAISSGEGNPDLPTAFRSGESGLDYGRIAALAVAGLGIGYALSRLVTPRRF